MTARTNAVIAQNASAYENSRNQFIGVAAGAIALALLLGFVLSWSVIGPIQKHRFPACCNRVGRLLGARGRHEPRRARCAGDEREPDERRAQAPLQRARDGQPAQVGLSRQHVARAADAAERDHRLLAGVARGNGRRREQEAGGVPRGHPVFGEPPALAHQRRARPLQGRSRAGRARARAVLVAGGARARRRDGARARDAGRGTGHARAERGRRRRRGRRAPHQAGDLQPALECREVHARRRLRRRVGDAGQRRGERLRGRHRARHCRSPISDVSSRSFSRPKPGSSRAREPVSAWRSRSGSSSCTAAGSGSTASSAGEARSSSRSPREASRDGGSRRFSSWRTTRRT